MKTKLLAIISILTIGASLHAAPADPPQIRELKDLSAEKAVFADATRKQLIVLKSSKDCKKYFSKDALAAISKAVDNAL